MHHITGHSTKHIFNLFTSSPYIGTMARQWTLTSQEGFDKSLQFNENAPVPSADQLKPDQVLVRIKAASLNYRDVDVASPTVSDAAGRSPMGTWTNRLGRAW